MSREELFSAYLLPAIVAVATALAGMVGAQIRALYQRWINDKTKEAVVRTCVKAAEQLYHDLSGAEKLQKAQEGVVEMLNEKGIPISELEMNLLIESVVSEFNYGFAKAGEVEASKSETETEEAVEDAYNEEDGASA